MAVLTFRGIFSLWQRNITIVSNAKVLNVHDHIYWVMKIFLITRKVEAYSETPILISRQGSDRPFVEDAIFLKQINKGGWLDPGVCGTYRVRAKFASVKYHFRKIETVPFQFLIAFIRWVV